MRLFYTAMVALAALTLGSCESNEDSENFRKITSAAFVETEIGNERILCTYRNRITDIYVQSIEEPLRRAWAIYPSCGGNVRADGRTTVPNIYSDTLGENPAKDFVHACMEVSPFPEPKWQSCRTGIF